MDLFGPFRLLPIPTWVRALTVVLLLLGASLSLLLIGRGLWDRTDASDWIAAGAGLLGVVLPLLIIAGIVWSAHSTVGSLQREARRYLTDTLPQFLRLIPEPDLNDAKRFPKQPARLDSEVADIKPIYIEGDFQCDYLIDIKHDPTTGGRAQILFRLELNVFRVNFILFVPPEHFEVAELMEHFPHTINGAQTVLQANEKEGQSNYIFNQSIGHRHRVYGKDYVTLVAYRKLPDNFLWNAAEKLFFAQDLVIMLRSFLYESKGLFAVAQAEGAQRVLEHS